MNNDFAFNETEKKLVELEKRINKIYAEASEDLGKTIKEYFDSFADRDAIMKRRLDAGEITKEYYTQWRLNQIGRGKRFEALQDKVADRATRANEVARSYVTDSTPGIYSLNRNYTAYSIDKQSGSVHTDWILFDEQTVKRLIIEEPDVMPYYSPAKALNRGIDLEYGKKKITQIVTSSILQGKSVKGMADKLQSNIIDMSRTSAIRAARTSITAAQNAGRMDSYAAAEKMGIQLKKQWLATLDGRTRHAHQALDGQVQKREDTFQSELGDIMYPGDPSAHPANVYNCRCTLVANIEGDYSDSSKRWTADIDPATGKTVYVENMTYTEWARLQKGNNTKDKGNNTDEINPLTGTIENILDKPIKSNDNNYNDIIQRLQNANVDYN